MAIDAKYQRKVPAVPRDYPRNRVFCDAGFARIGGRGELGETVQENVRFRLAAEMETVTHDTVDDSVEQIADSNSLQDGYRITA
jgi:hypothetical protein